MILFLILFSIASSEANVLKGRSILIDESAPQENKAELQQQQQESVQVKPSKKNVQLEKSNLPKEYSRKIENVEISDKVAFVPSKVDLTLNGLRPGNMVRAIIDQEIIVSQNVPNPIRAIILSGSLGGNYILGEATLDKDLKRALITFSKILLKNKNEVYAFKGHALSLKGSIGLEGEYHNQSAKFIVGEFLSAGMAGYLDSTISRNQNNQGNYVSEPSVSNSAKAGAVSALSKSTERFAEAARATSDYTKVNGFNEIQIVVTEEPVLQK